MALIKTGLLKPDNLNVPSDSVTAAIGLFFNCMLAPGRKLTPSDTLPDMVVCEWATKANIRKEKIVNTILMPKNFHKRRSIMLTEHDW